MLRVIRLLLIIAGLLIFAISSAGQGCPKVVVSAPEGLVPPGEVASFTARLDAPAPGVRFHWTVNPAVIESGQGTSEINVRTTREMSGQRINATVSLVGLPFCSSTAEEYAVVDTNLGCVMPSDEWDEGLKPKYVRPRLDAFFVQLMNNPTHKGVVVILTADGQQPDPDDPRIRAILSHVRNRKFDVSRLAFRIGTGDQPKTILWRVPPGGVTPYDNLTPIAVSTEN